MEFNVSSDAYSPGRYDRLRSEDDHHRRRTIGAGSRPLLRRGLSGSEVLVSRQVRTLRRLEGLAVLAAGVALYFGLEASRLTFALLFFVPDVSMIGYLRNREAGTSSWPPP